MPDPNNRNRQAQQRQTRARLTQAESRLNELRAQRPAAPRTPSVPDADGSGYASKTNDPACKAAASAWQKAVKNGQVAPPEVYAQLARCREAARGGGGNQWAYHQQGRDYRASNQFVGPQSSRVEMQRRNQPAPAQPTPTRAEPQQIDRAADLVNRVRQSTRHGRNVTQAQLNRTDAIQRRSMQGPQLTAEMRNQLRNGGRPVIQGPNLPSIGRDAWENNRIDRGHGVRHSNRVANTSVVEQRAGAARALRMLRNSGAGGQAEARHIRNAASQMGPEDRGSRMIREIASMRSDRGNEFYRRRGQMESQAQRIGTGGNIPTDAERQAYRRSTAEELVNLRRIRNANFVATGTHGPNQYWRDTVNHVQVGQSVTRPQRVDPNAYNVTALGARRDAVRNRLATMATPAPAPAPPPPPAATSRNLGTAAGTATSRRRAANRMSPANSTTGSGAPSPTAAQNVPQQRNYPVPPPEDRSTWRPPQQISGKTAVPIASNRAIYYHNTPPIAAADVMRDTPNPQSQIPSTSRVPRTVGTSAYTPQQLAEAQRQAGPAPDYASRSQHNLQARADHVHHAENALGLKLMGSTTDEKFNHLVSLAGYSPAYADKITLRNGADTYASITIMGPGGNREIKLDRRHRPHIHNNVHFPTDEHRANGQALDQYARSIVAARAAGVDAISVEGAGNGNGVGPRTIDRTGYYVWPSWGFDAKIDRAGGNSPDAIRQAHPALANVQTYGEAFFHPDKDVASLALRAHMAHHTGDMPYVTLPLQDTSGVFQNFVTHYERSLKRSQRKFADHTLRSVVTRNGGFE